MGRCADCGAWNSFVEERIEPRNAKSARSTKPFSKPVPVTEIQPMQEQRLSTGMREFDRVLGGGLVPGGVFLVGGAPGMGKSTLLLQVGGKLTDAGKTVIYISGEESLVQIKMRADRLGVHSDRFHLCAETDVDAIADLIRNQPCDLVVVDSIQTMYNSELETIPGNISQVRLCGHILNTVAKEMGVPLFLIGHVTKDGNLAGPRVLEHLVDGLLLLEGDRQHLYRLVRAVKNRFGSTNEIGLFEMKQEGLVEVSHPSEFLLSGRQDGASGSVVTVSMEGSRPMLVEVQALVTPSVYGVPQRTATGFDHKRLSILIAVLEKRLGLRLGNQDVFVNAAGGLRLKEPATDLAMTSALISSFRDTPVSSDMVIMGEVGLTGEIRGVPHLDRRMAEAERMGFKTWIVPKIGLTKSAASDHHTISVDTISKLEKHLFH